MMSRSRLPVFALLVANTLSFLAEAITVVAIPWFVFELTGSAAKVGLIGFFTVLPRILAIFLGGQLVDRAGFRTSSVVSDVLSGASVCGIPLLYMAGELTFSWLVVLVIIGAVLDGPGATAKEAAVPELASMAGIELDRMNALFQGSRRLSAFIGPMIAGFLVAWVGSSNVLWVNAAAFGLSALLVLSLVPSIASREPEPESPGSFWANTTLGFRFLRQHRLLFWLAGFLCLTNFLEAPLSTVQIPAIVRENYGSADKVGMLLGAHGVGALIGTIVFSAISPKLPRRTTFITSFLLCSPLGLVFAMAPPYPVAVAASLVMGLFAGPLNPILMSVRQERVPIRYRARVFGTLMTLAFIAIPLGQLGGGYMVEWFGVQAVFAGVAVVYIAVVVSMFFTPVLHEMDERPVDSGGGGKISPASPEASSASA
jgi:MFS family permease